MQITDTLNEYKEVDYNTITETSELFTVLSNVDAIRIFLYAQKGITNSTHAIKDLNLTPKRFYSRLKELIDTGIIIKEEGKYSLTPKGFVLSKIGYTIFEVLNNKDRIELILNLAQSKSLTVEERVKVNNLLLENSEISKIIGPIVNGISYGKVETISTYEVLVSRLNEEVMNSKKAVRIATTYFEPLTLDTAVKTIQSGVLMQCLMSKKTMSKKITKLRMLLSPKSILSMLELLKASGDINRVYREVEVPFSYAILDGERCFFEFPQIGDEDFSIAFYLIDRNVADKFQKYFDITWKENDKTTSSELFSSFKSL
jgi:predicted transcriptional regulator